MIIEKYMIVGITYDKETVDDVEIVNNVYTNTITDIKNINLSIDFNVIKTPKHQLFYLDYKRYSTKQKAIKVLEDTLMFNHYNEVEYWTITEVLENTYDISEIRRYKLNKVINKLNKSLYL